MLVNELREVIKKYNDREKDKIIDVLYKRIPKKIKENYEIDNYIINLEQNLESKPKKEEYISFEQLEKEVEYFLMCAENDWYASPNKIIPKKERSKWRFKVKKYYKELTSIDPNTEDGRKATELLRQIFEILSLGTHYLKFSNWDTFKAIQISQPDFFEIIVKRKLMEGFSKQNIAYCVDLLDVEKDPYIIFEDLLSVFISNLKTNDMKYIAIELIEEKIEAYYIKLQTLKKEKRKTYYVIESINDFTKAAFYIYLGLYETETGIKFYHKYYIETDQEVKEYILLEILDEFKLDSIWIDEYEKKLGKIDYRDTLKEEYINKKSKNK